MTTKRFEEYTIKELKGIVEEYQELTLKYKRCPHCGTLSLNEAKRCAGCEAHFVT